MSFVHLHTHSHYSLLAGLSKIEELVDKAKEFGQPALALTDHGNLYGAIPFYKECRKKGIKPIVGVDFYMAEESRLAEFSSQNRVFHIVLLAETNEGYKNLLKLITYGHLEGFASGRPRIDKDLMRKYGTGLIALSGDIQGEIPRALWADDTKRAERLVNEYKTIFGEDNFFIEISHHPHIERHNEIEEALAGLAKKTSTPLVAAHGSYYILPEDKEAHRTLLSIQHGSTPESARFFSQDEDFSFISSDKAREFFKKIPDAIENTLRIAERCVVEIKSPGWIFPELPITKGTTHDEQLRAYAYEGITQRGLSQTKEIIDRLEYELDIIKKKGFAPYFLVVADLIYYARKHNIVSTIRGSVAGSLVTYLTKITNVNPLEYKLPFERFLNPERPSPPDIDMDFADDRRDEMILYAKEKYGEDKVAQIGTFGTMLARAVVRDVARALGYPYSIGDRIAKLIPFGSQGFAMTIDKAMKLEPDLLAAYENEKDTREIIDLARRIEGNARHVSVHAAGVVISPTPLIEHVPLQREPQGEKIITQYDMYDIEEIGLLKFDFLGIRNLAILANSVELVEKMRGIRVDIENIPLDDKKTFGLLSRGETMGLFQLGGSGMTHYLKELKPTSIKDINAMVALYRPGPMESIPEYIRRKHNPSLVTYLDPRMKEILADSYGVITYQDDVLLIAITLAGYSWLEADKLRKAMGKKIPAEMQGEKEKLIKGAVAKGMTEEKARGLWLLIEPFAAYGFNKAHAACYGRVAYQTAYMKANFPGEYMTAVLTAESGDVEEISKVVAECIRMGIPVLPPDVNESFGGFTVIKNKEGDKIRFGLYTIKNLGEGIASHIIEERKRNGRFSDFIDFIDRIRHDGLNRRALEALVKSGALDTLGERGQMLANIEHVLNYVRENMRRGISQSLFTLMNDKSSVPTLKLLDAAPAKQEDKLLWEKELLGLYLSGHPLDKFKERFSGKKTIKDYKTFGAGIPCVVGGLIEEVRTVTTRRGERMAFAKLSDFDDSIEVVFFPGTYQERKSHIRPDVCVAVKGRLSMRNNTPSIVAEDIKEL